jgi:hypothetical protein
MSTIFRLFFAFNRPRHIMSRLSTLCVSFILLLTCTTSAKTAHYPDHQDLKDLRVLWPPQRTFRSSHLPEPGTSLCSNYPKPSANRTAFPINGAPVQFYINSTGPRFGQPLYSVHLIPSVDESNGTAGDQFDWEHDRIQHAEEFKSGFGCFGNVNISAWRKPVVGMNATLRITALLYLGGGGEVRVCSPLVVLMIFFRCEPVVLMGCSAPMWYLLMIRSRVRHMRRIVEMGPGNYPRKKGEVVRDL